ncbi:MAG: hypothetical protein JST51_15045 [Armatimonadetes bacterium]|nr:hypothetical protein [Armatimonadota bacterium]
MSSILALAVLLHGPAVQAQPVELTRKFSEGEKLSYFARAQFTDEQRQGILQTFIPHDQEISYHYSMSVQKVKAGIAEILYQRPNMSITMGDTAESAAKTMTEKLDIKMLLGISSINKIVSQKDLNPKKDDDDDGGGLNRKVVSKVMRQGSQADQVAIGLLINYLGDIERLAFFVGPVDSGLDIAPELPIDEVKVGDTWKATVGYSPQKLKGSEGKLAVQRIDYTYTYLGPMKDSEGKDIQRVEAKVKLDTDLTDYAQQIVGGSKASSYLKSVPLTFEGTIRFDLDPKTLHMIKAFAESKGAYSVNAKGAEQGLLEGRFHGRTTVKMDGHSMGGATTVPEKKGKGGKGGR